MPKFISWEDAEKLAGRRINPATIPDKVILSRAGEAMSNARKHKRGGGPKKMRLCPECKEEHATRALLAHLYNQHGWSYQGAREWCKNN